MLHRSFRPSDFAWRDLPLRLGGLAAAPAAYVIRSAGFWPEADGATDRPGRIWRWRVGLALGFAVLLPLGYPLSAGPASFLDGAGVTSGQLIPLYEPLLWNRGRPAVRPWMEYVSWCKGQGRRVAAD